MYWLLGASGGQLGQLAQHHGLTLLGRRAGLAIHNPDEQAVAVFLKQAELKKAGVDDVTRLLVDHLGHAPQVKLGVGDALADLGQGGQLGQAAQQGAAHLPAAEEPKAGQGQRGEEQEQV